MPPSESVGKAQNNVILIPSHMRRGFVGAQECCRYCARRFAPRGNRDAVDCFRPILAKRRSYCIQIDRTSAGDQIQGEASRCAELARRADVARPAERLVEQHFIRSQPRT
jgi:hypothetical protein